MKPQLLLTVAISTLLIGCHQQAAESETEQPAAAILDTQEKRISYSIGIGLGQRFKDEAFVVDLDTFTQGLKDAINDGEQLMTQEEIMAEMQAFQQQQMVAQQEAADKLANDNQAAGAAYLAENGAKEGVTTTASGLQYEVITAGDGDKPAATDTVEVHYAGTLLDGTEFDSSYKRGATVSFPLNGVIPGWTEGLQLMPVGSKYRFVIPSDLAYGPGGTRGGPIGPNATLIFEVELVAIKDAAAEG